MCAKMRRNVLQWHCGRLQWVLVEGVKVRPRVQQQSPPSPWPSPPGEGMEMSLVTSTPTASKMI
jgi:hypothetical protein